MDNQLYKESIAIIKDVFKIFKERVNEIEDNFKSCIITNFENQ